MEPGEFQDKPHVYQRTPWFARGGLVDTLNTAKSMFALAAATVVALNPVAIDLMPKGFGPPADHLWSESCQSRLVIDALQLRCLLMCRQPRTAWSEIAWYG